MDSSPPVPEIEVCFRCVPCDITFGSEEILKQHFLISHKEFAIVKDDENRLKAVQIKVETGSANLTEEFSDRKCTKCNKTFDQFSHLIDHIGQVHTNDNTDSGFKCGICQARFARKRYLQTHIRRIHERTEQCHCLQCGKQFTSWSHLKEHIAYTHNTTIQDWVCGICDTRFACERYLERHFQRTHNNAKPLFRCPNCDRKFPIRSHLLRHSRNCKRRSQMSQFEEQSPALFTIGDVFHLDVNINEQEKAASDSIDHMVGVKVRIAQKEIVLAELARRNYETK